MKNLYLILFSYLFFFSCKKDSPMPLLQVTGYDAPQHVNGEGLNIDSFYIVPLESKENIIISDIRKIENADSLFIILSPEGVFSFNKQGRFSCRYGARGNGAGEYNTLTSMWVDEQDFIHIVDGTRNRILVFNTVGDLLETQTYSPGTFDLLNDCAETPNNHLFCSHYIYNNLNTLYTDFDLHRKESTHLHYFSGKTANTQEHTGRHAFTIQQDTAFCISPFSPDIYYWTTSCTDIRPFLSISTKQEILSEKEQATIEDFGIMRYTELMNQNIFVGFTDLFVTPQHYFLGFHNLTYFLVDKTTKKGVTYDYFITPDEISHLPLLNISAVDPQGFLIGFEEAYKLKQWKFNTASQDKNLRKIETVVQALSSEDNPCLLFYKLR